MAADDRAKLLKLVDALNELDQKRSAIMSEMAVLLSGGEGIGAKLGRLKAAWCAIWTERHHEKCAFDHVKHTAFLKEKLLKGFTEEQIIAKFQSYIANDEAYYVRARHPFGLFRTNFDTWRGLPYGTNERTNEGAARVLQELRGQ